MTTKCRCCSNYPSDQEAKIFGYHRKAFFSMNINICHHCADLLFSYWNAMNSLANRLRLMKHEQEKASLDDVKEIFTYESGNLEDSLDKFLSRIGYLIGLKKEKK